MRRKKMSAALPKGSIVALRQSAKSGKMSDAGRWKKRQRARKKSGDYWRQRPAKEKKNLVTEKKSDGVLNKRRSNVARGKSQRGARKTAHEKTRRRVAWPKWRSRNESKKICYAKKK